MVVESGRASFCPTNRIIPVCVIRAWKSTVHYLVYKVRRIFLTKSRATGNFLGISAIQRSNLAATPGAGNRGRASSANLQNAPGAPDRGATGRGQECTYR